MFQDLLECSLSNFVELQKNARKESTVLSLAWVHAWIVTVILSLRTMKLGRTSLKAVRRPLQEEFCGEDKPVFGTTRNFVQH